MLFSLKKERNVHFTQRVSSKTSISGLSSENVHFTLTRDSKDVDFNYKKEQNVRFTQRRLNPSVQHTSACPLIPEV